MGGCHFCGVGVNGFRLRDVDGRKEVIGDGGDGGE